jgi:hypothetical protein
MFRVRVDPSLGLMFLGITPPHIRFTRDLTMFMLGGAAFTYETLSGTDRPNVLYGALALMGVAAYLRGMAEGDRSNKKDDK